RANVLHHGESSRRGARRRRAAWIEPGSFPASFKSDLKQPLARRCAQPQSIELLEHVDQDFEFLFRLLGGATLLHEPAEKELLVRQNNIAERIETELRVDRALQARRIGWRTGLL